MAYLQHSNWRERPGAVVSVIAIHAVVGYALVTGLSFSQIIKAIDNPDAVDVIVPIDPPPPPPEPEPKADPKMIENPVVAPLPPVDLSPQRPPLVTTVEIPPLTDIVPKVFPSPTPGPTARPSPTFNPIPPIPRNNPGSWVTTDDYRSSWINRELIGTARFRLQIAASGKVENCTITGSSGHAELDKATCDLVTRRARFDPAKDNTGATVSGTYTSSVRWELPE
jgi:protein TonB